MNHTNLFYANAAGLALSTVVFGAAPFSTTNFVVAASITGTHLFLDSLTFAAEQPKLFVAYTVQKPKSSILLGVAVAAVVNRFF